MNRPVNFEKINHKTFIEDAIEYRISESSTGVWIIPTDEFKNQFDNVILVDMMWIHITSDMVWNSIQKNGKSVHVRFCRVGHGTHVVSATTYTIKNTDLYRMEDFINWCRGLVNTFQNKLKK